MYSIMVNSTFFYSTYYINTKAVIMVIDSTDQARLNISTEELHKMMELEVKLIEHYLLSFEKSFLK